MFPPEDCLTSSVTGAKKSVKSAASSAPRKPGPRSSTSISRYGGAPGGSGAVPPAVTEIPVEERDSSGVMLVVLATTRICPFSGAFEYFIAFVRPFVIF
jgi:hypothetical protein